ncbi:sodium- and chloride-dependent glycine transporter 2-like [Ixodes scapularis]|nr:sodium- and chloride-dependent glycine transporter 2-like [Ixodes scapularis]
MDEPREQWDSNLEFLLGSIGMSIGLGNIWRFPYVAYENGGGAFLIPYIIIMTLVGRSMFYMEMLLGQFRSAGATLCFDCVPLARGVGWTMVYTCFAICAYYNLLLSYSLNYLYYSFYDVLPWTVCNPDWANDECYDKSTVLKACKKVNSTLYKMYIDSNSTRALNDSAVLGGKFGDVLVPLSTYADAIGNCSEQVQSSPEQFFNRQVLNRSGGIEELGTLQGGLVLGLLISWIAVFLSVFKGVRSSGKVSYFTALTPFFILGVIMVRGVTLPGAMDGLKYYLLPKWEQLFTFKVWRSAAVQIFFSISLAQGLNMCLASYNEFSNNIVRNVYVIAVADSFTSIFGGVVIFSVLGNMALQLDTTIPEVMRGGFGLAFAVYPHALSQIPGAHFWSVAFFTMLFLLAIDSEFGFVESALTPLKDEFPVLRVHQSKLALACAVFFFLLGLPIASQGGIYMINLLDEYVSSHLIPWVGVAELVTLVFGYGIRRLMTDMEFMLGQPPSELTYYSWKYLCPACAIILAIASLATAQLAKLEDYVYPLAANLAGITFVVIGLSFIPIFVVIELRNADWDLRKAVRPRDNWGPKNLEQRRLYRLFMVQRGYMEPKEAEALSLSEEKLRNAQKLEAGGGGALQLETRPPVEDIPIGDKRPPSEV